MAPMDAIARPTAAFWDARRLRSLKRTSIHDARPGRNDADAEVLKLIDQSHPSAAIIGRMFQTKSVIVAGIHERFARRLHYQLAGAGYLDIFLDPR